MPPDCDPKSPNTSLDWVTFCRENRGAPLAVFQAWLRDNLPARQPGEDWVTLDKALQSMQDPLAFLAHLESSDNAALLKAAARWRVEQQLKE